MNDLLGNYRLVLGLEIHLHLKTVTKMFCGDSADVYDLEPNMSVCPVCLGLPGALPVPNREAVKFTHMLGSALNCELNQNSKFDRKHYFYPDLPKGYQISQYKEPLCGEGFLILDSGQKAEIERIHLEEDTAKSFHEGNKTLIDFNKSGMPLVEIVTKPIFTSIEDAVDFSKKIQDAVRFLGIGDVDMEKGQMRLEANISLRTKEMEEKGELHNYKVEIKNINSFRFMERAVKAEIKRQKEILEKGEMPIQENRGWDEVKGITVSQREKEEAKDYRYFPEPDIPPMVFTEEYFEEIRASLPELPWDRKGRLIKDHGLSADTAGVLSSGGNIHLYEKFSQLVGKGFDPVKTANLLVNKKEFWDMSVEEVELKIKEAGDKVSDESVLKGIVEKVIEQNQKSVTDYRSGKTASLEFLVGQVMRETKGKADSSVVRGLLTDLLESN
jgi:aspartyl-tRNA(Asn)/glutamyl-tRNA(Gln) amidotransferase subunit B